MDTALEDVVAQVPILPWMTRSPWSGSWRRDRKRTMELLFAQWLCAQEVGTTFGDFGGSVEELAFIGEHGRGTWRTEQLRV
jgi:hypothetical protein